jgi:hypothetical protein
VNNGYRGCPVNSYDAVSIVVLKACAVHTDILAICLKNKPFLAETLKAGKSVAEPPENKTGRAEAFVFFFALPTTQGSPTIRL